MEQQEINPQETTRAEAFELWMNAPNPMVTFFKKIDVTNLVHISRNLSEFNHNYLKLTKQVKESCRNHDLSDYMVIGTSAIIDTEIDGAVGMNSGIFNNPFLIWGKYHRGFMRTTLTISFQFHHTQMDGAHAGLFLKLLQRNINEIGRKYLIKR